MEQTLSLFMQRGKVGTNHAECLSTILSAKAPRYFLLNLGHAHRLLSDVVGKRYILIRHEPPYVVGI